MFRDARFLTLADASHLLRRRETWIWAFALPIVFFYFIGTITSRWGDSGESKDPLAVYVPASAGPMAENLLERFGALDYSIIRVSNPADLSRYERRLSIPEDFSGSIQARRQTTVEFTRNEAGLNADQDTVRLNRAIYTLLGDLVVLKLTNQPETLAAVQTLDRAPRLIRVVSKPAGRRKVPPSGFEQAVPGCMVFFVLLVLLTSGAATLVAERDQGILRRLASSPMSRQAVVAGKWGARMLLACIQIAFAMVAGALLFHVHWGSNVLMVIVVLLAYAAFAAAAGVLLGSVARSRGQVAAFGSIAANVLAALGGCWWPAEIMPRSMQAVSRATPPGMAMDALHQLVNFGSGPAAALPQTIALAALAVILGFFAARTFRFQ